MGDKSNIEWTEATWNPVIGCSKVSPGCAHCYAEELHRTRLDGKGAYPGFRPWTPENAEHNVRFLPERLDQPLRWTKPRMIFVNSMSDLFHERLLVEQVAAVFAVMSLATKHTFQVLTKRPETACLLLTEANFWLQVNAARMKMGFPVLPGGMSDFAAGEGDLPLPNVWLGTSIENRRFVERADWLRRTPGVGVRWISAEPLLGPIVAGSWARESAGSHVPDGEGLSFENIDWIVVGGESGPKHRPMRVEWVRDVRDEARAAGTAFFFKQWGGRTPKAGGRKLDGRTWDEYPRGES